VCSWRGGVTCVWTDAVSGRVLAPRRGGSRLPGNDRRKQHHTRLRYGGKQQQKPLCFSPGDSRGSGSPCRVRVHVYGRRAAERVPTGAVATWRGVCARAMTAPSKTRTSLETRPPSSSGVGEKKKKCVRRDPEIENRPCVSVRTLA